jgi:hypothetical protein
MPSTLRMPLAVAPGRGLLALEQGGSADIAQSVALLLSTTPGDRRSVPDYGLPNPLGSGVEVAELIEVIGEWEDRADPTFVEELADGIVQQFAVSPGSEVGLGAARPPAPALVNGPRYSVGLGVDPDTGRVFIDPDSTDRLYALKVDADGRPYAEIDPEPQALPVGVDGADAPYFERE